MRSHTTSSKIILVALAGLLLMPSALAATATKKESGTADSAALDLTLDGPTHATLRLDQTWQGARAAAMRQSLDAYFGNGDGRLSPDEERKVTTAAAHDLMNQTYPGILVDEQPSHVANATVTMTGAGTNDTSTPLVLHHEVELSVALGAGASHTLALTPLWNGTFALHVPAGEAFADGTPNQSGALAAGTQLVVTFGPPPPPATPSAPAASTPTAPQANASANTTTTPTESIAPPKPVPALGGVVLVGALAALALLVRRRS